MVKKTPAGPGHLFVISAPSGAGKTTLWQEVVRDLDNIVRSVSITTRPARKGEIAGGDYFFIDKAAFEQQRAGGKLLEWANVFGYYYGTPQDKVNELLKQGQDVILSIDVQGARQIKQNHPAAVLIFILPPDTDTLYTRLKERDTETETEIQKRLKQAQKEITASKEYDFIVVNDDLNSALKELKEIIFKTRDTH